MPSCRLFRRNRIRFQMVFALMQITSSGNGHTVIYKMKLDLLNKLNLLNNFGFQEFDMRDAIIFHPLKYKKFTSRRI